jgi:ribonuclease HII
MNLGIDEAGRGPVMGPLVVAGVWIRTAHEHKLLEIGVRDSKTFGSSCRAQRRRGQLAAQIRELAVCATVLVVDAAEVARRVRLGELNLLEQELAVAMIASGPEARRILADGEKLFRPLAETYPRLKARDRADETCPCVAAASILAKVERDTRYLEIVQGFEAEFGPIRGGGYPNRGTADFLWAYYERYGALPPEVRESWSWPVLREINRRKAGVRPSSRGEQLTLPVT